MKLLKSREDGVYQARCWGYKENAQRRRPKLLKEINQF